MIHLEPSFEVNVDATNPGQVIACCGLLELAHRQWKGVEGWFDREHFLVAVPGDPSEALGCLIKEISVCEISGLTEAERDEFKALDGQRRQLKKESLKLTDEQEKRRSELGAKAREGDIRLGTPFGLLLDWWSGADDESTPKTWAGRQEIHKVARAAQDAIAGIQSLEDMMNYACVLRATPEYDEKGSKKVEPFYFDARRFAHRLDAGFSLDALGMESDAYPAVELFCMVGLQRFRPAPALGEKRTFDYWTWCEPLGAPVAAAVFSGIVPSPGSKGYRFSLRFRDDQKRYKAFGQANLTGGGL